MAIVNDTPAEPTPAQCSAKERVSIPGRPNTRAHAVWWPQMGGYVAQAVLTAGECPEAWVWHNGAFPFSSDGKPGHSPAHLSMSDADQWIRMFEKQLEWQAEERGDEPEPYVWVLPQGVSREQAQEVYEKIVAWGLWELDPGGFRIRTYEEATGPCEPVPCPPFNEVALQTSRYAWAGPDEPAPIDQKPDSEWLDSWMDTVSAATAAGFRQIDFLPAPGPAQMPRIVTLPEGVNPEEADRWVQGCIQLGAIEAGTGGVLYLPHGQQP
jgi:hypothetical protein